MTRRHDRLTSGAGGLLVALLAVAAPGCGGTGTQKQEPEEAVELTHEQTLEWVRENRAWRRAHKVKPIFARPVERAEVGKEYQTADRAVERAREGYWLCAGVAGEPWFQKKERIDARYEPGRREDKKFAFDDRPHSYQVFKPKGDVRNWAAQVRGTWHGKKIKGFVIQANYDKEHPLAAPAGGYVVRDDTADPYRDRADDVWLVQEGLFDSTYELLP
jgi:hypothetical protein